MNGNPSSFFSWLKSWDFMAILYSTIASFVFLIILKWVGIYDKFYRKYKYAKAKKTYKKNIAEECGLLIVIGRRKGFKLEDVYVSLDTAPSDLMQSDDNDTTGYSLQHQSCVLVGGPGAGKSTTVKEQLLRDLNRKNSFPVFLRLRDYVGFESIESYIIHKFETAGFENSEIIMQELLRSGKCFCVLDGLDEVRPQLRIKVTSDINSLFHKYFTQNNRLIVTCRKEAYRRILLDIPVIIEVRPLSDQQIQRFAKKWPLGYPQSKSPDTFWRDLSATPRILGSPYKTVQVVKKMLGILCKPLIHA